MQLAADLELGIPTQSGRSKVILVAQDSHLGAIKELGNAMEGGGSWGFASNFP